MKKYIFVLNAIELLAQLMNGKRVKGVLYLDQNTGKLTFKAYNRQVRIREKDVMVKKLPWGEGVNATRQGVWQFPQGVQYGSGNGTLRGAYQGGKERLD